MGDEDSGVAEGDVGGEVLEADVEAKVFAAEEGDEA